MNAFEQLQSFGSDSSDRLALILAAPVATDESLCLKAVYQPSHVGCALNHALGDFTARMPFRVNATQSSEHVVLRPSEAVPLAHGINYVLDGTGSNRHAQQCLLLRVCEAGLFEPATESLGHVE